jgi:D-serine deaminase-like pyridoxal phosphate-dependent protein
MQMRSSTLSGNTYPLSLQPLGGKVGIGTSAPTTTLDVAGDLNASGTITGGTIIARYQDVAEWVPSTQKLEAGTVVVLDSEMTNHVRASSKPYDTRVAGVVSARPGITLGEGGAGKLLVATTGRVKVKVDATRSPVRVGDLLVTGEEEGAAIKSEPLDIGGAQIHRPGTIIGKALEPLAKGRGEILVLLSLQ